MEKAVLMMNYLNVTQGANNNFSHKGDCALDLGGKDSGRDDLKAPFTGTIKRIYPNCNAVWLQSKEKVKYADGTVDYMTLLVCHDNSVTSLYEGKEVKQGEVFYQEGTKGYATGNHIHLTIGKGKYTGGGWHQNEYGTWVVNNQYSVHKGLFLDEKTKVINDGGYKWVKTNTYVIEEPKPVAKYLNISPEADYRTIYKTTTLTPENALAKINPKKYGGLSYKILKDCGNSVVQIDTDMFGKGYISSKEKYYCSVDDKPLYKNGNY